MWSLFDEFQILNYTMAMLPPDFSCSSSHVAMVSGDTCSVKKRKKEEIEETTMRTQKAISESISLLAKSGDRSIELEKKLYMNNAEIITCNNSNLAFKMLIRNNMRQLLRITKIIFRWWTKN